MPKAQHFNSTPSFHKISALHSFYRWIFVGFMCLTVALYGPSLHAAAKKKRSSAPFAKQIGWVNGSFEDIKKKAQKANKPILLYWGAKWCGNCKQLKKRVFSKRPFQTLVKSSYVAVYINADRSDADQWEELLDLTNGLPEVVLYGKEGKEWGRLETDNNLEDFLQEMRDIRKKHGT